MTIKTVRKKRTQVKLIAIGNSKGLRLPKPVIQKYHFGDMLMLEETDKGILISNLKDGKLSWDETFKEMAREREDWKDFDATIADGLDDEF